MGVTPEEEITKKKIQTKTKGMSKSLIRIKRKKKLMRKKLMSFFICFSFSETILKMSQTTH
jgi:hypothetical protein